MHKASLFVAVIALFAAGVQAETVTAGVSKDRAAVAAVPAPKVVIPQDVGTQATTVINFDLLSAPSSFISTTALAAVGSVGFNGSSLRQLDGGAVLNFNSNFGVTGYSAPNFLAFNCGAHLADGGIPRLAELVTFPSPVSGVSLTIGSGLDVGKTITLWGLGSGGAEKRVAHLSSAMQTVSFHKPLSSILVTGNACVFVVDDLTYTN